MVDKGVLYFDTLAWTRMSVFKYGWGDKEYLFHLFLTPFTLGDPFIGAKLALSILNGAPHVAYLNVLDPVFMASRYPDSNDALEKMFAGRSPDKPSAVLRRLDSEYIAFHRAVFPGLAAQIDRDPGMVLVLDTSGHSIARVVDIPAIEGPVR